jgi:hypothetical protein
MAGALDDVGGTKLLNPVKMVIRPVSKALSDLMGDSGVLVLIVGVVLLIASLKFLVDLLKMLMRGRAERVLHRTLFRSAVAFSQGPISSFSSMVCRFCYYS